MHVRILVPIECRWKDSHRTALERLIDVTLTGRRDHPRDAVEVTRILEKSIRNRQASISQNVAGITTGMFNEILLMIILR